MSIITNVAVTEYRKRRADRLSKRLDDDWITIKGTHVLVDDEGKITAGPDRLKNRPEKPKNNSNTGLSDAAKPTRGDYEHGPDDSVTSFIHKNVEKLRPIYEEKGSDGLEEEWFKTRLQDCTKDLRKITADEAEDILDENIDYGIAHMWLNEYSHEVKPKLVHQLTGNKDIHNAALNVMYDNYRFNCEREKTEPLSFEEFLVTPIKMYRGGNGKEHGSTPAFSSYTFDKNIAEQFRDSEIGSKVKTDKGVVYEAEIRPIDTYGSLLTNGEMEVFVPGFLAPNGKYDGVDERLDGVTWEWSDPVKWAYEDALELWEKAQELKGERRAELLDSIIRDAEAMSLFEGNKSSVGQEFVERCAEEIQKTVLQLTALDKAENEDGAFFAGELNENIGEFENPPMSHVDAFRERRQKRLDAKEGDGRWITTEEDHKIHLNENGVPDKGNPYVIKAMTSGTKTPEEIGKGKFQKTRDRVKKSMADYHAAFEKVEKLAEEYAKANKEFTQAERTLDMIDNVYKKTLSGLGIEEKDGDKLKQEVAELKKRAEERPTDREIQGQYNNRKFVLAEYEEVYGEEAKQLRKDFGKLKKENDDAKKALDAGLEKRRTALSEAKKHMADRDAQSLKFYTESERNDAVNAVLSSSAFSRIGDDDKSSLSESIKNASDAQLCVLQKTIKNARVFSVGYTATPKACSHYNSGSGCMYMEDEDMGNPRVFWHEYGHYMDDTSRSGMDIKETSKFEGSIYEITATKFSSLLRDNVKIYGEDAAKDFQEMFDRVAPGEIKVKTNSDGDWLSVSCADDSMSDVEAQMRIQKAFDKAFKEFIDDGPDGGKLAEYYKSVGYPTWDEGPKRSDYFVSYVTPKRKLEREKEKFKGAEEKYWKELGKYYDKQREVEKNTPEFHETVGKLSREKADREKKLPPITDCMCASLHGAVFSIYGCHDPGYYRAYGKAEEEWAANIHQMMFMGQTDAIDFMSKLMPRTMKKVKAAYNEYLWRNME